MIRPHENYGKRINPYGIQCDDLYLMYVNQLTTIFFYIFICYSKIIRHLLTYLLQFTKKHTRKPTLSDTHITDYRSRIHPHRFISINRPQLPALSYPRFPLAAAPEKQYPRRAPLHMRPGTANLLTVRVIRSPPVDGLAFRGALQRAIRYIYLIARPDGRAVV